MFRDFAKIGSLKEMDSECLPSCGDACSIVAAALDKHSLEAYMWEEEHTILLNNISLARCAHKSPLPGANLVPTQHNFRTVLYICLQSTVHQPFPWDMLANAFFAGWRESGMLTVLQQGLILSMC